MGMTTIKYKGFKVLAQPYQLCESKRWTVDFEIHRHGRGQAFSAGERYQTEQEADARCAGLGRVSSTAGNRDGRSTVCAARLGAAGRRFTSGSESPCVASSSPFS